MYGRTCINIDCLPSKCLIIEAGNGIDFVDAVNGKNDMTAMLRGKNYHMLADEKTVTVLDGAGYIGLEFASMFAKYGSEVTVLDLHENLLPRKDEDIAALTLNSESRLLKLIKAQFIMKCQVKNIL